MTENDVDAPISAKSNIHPMELLQNENPDLYAQHMKFWSEFRPTISSTDFYPDLTQSQADQYLEFLRTKIFTQSKKEIVSFNDIVECLTFKAHELIGGDNIAYHLARDSAIMASTMTKSMGVILEGSKKFSLGYYLELGENTAPIMSNRQKAVFIKLGENIHKHSLMQSLVHMINHLKEMFPSDTSVLDGLVVNSPSSRYEELRGIYSPCCSISHEVLTRDTAVCLGSNPIAFYDRDCITHWLSTRQICPTTRANIDTNGICPPSEEFLEFLDLYARYGDAN
jgi:hypothetical protein